MRIDCDSCTAPPSACAECVMTVLLRRPVTDVAEFGGVDLDDAERAAIDTLAGAGLVPPLRLVPVLDSDGARRAHRRRTAS